MRSGGICCQGQENEESGLGSQGQIGHQAVWGAGRLPSYVIAVENGRTSLLLVGLPQGISNPGPILSPLVHDGALENLIWKDPKREESRAPVLDQCT